MSDESQFDKPPYRWSGVRRATLIGAMIGLSAAVALSFYDPPPRSSDGENAPVMVHFTRGRGVHMVSLGSHASPWTVLPLAGAGLGFLQRLVRNNWRW